MRLVFTSRPGIALVGGNFDESPFLNLPKKIHVQFEMLKETVFFVISQHYLTTYNFFCINSSQNPLFAFFWGSIVPSIV